MPTREWGEALFQDLERSLAWGELQAVGVDVRSEAFVRIPAAAWRLEFPRRLPHSYKPIPITQWEAARQEMTVMVSILGPEVRPAVSLHALMAWAGAAEVPEPPCIVPLEERKPATPVESKPTALADWMHGYATACKQRGGLVKREDAIKVLCAAKQCTYREAEAAYESLPYPDLRNPPRV